MTTGVAFITTSKRTPNPSRPGTTRTGGTVAWLSAVAMAMACGCLFTPDRSVENRDREPLRVLSVNVQDEETDVPRNRTIEVTFNQPLDPQSLDDAKMKLASGSLRVSADVRHDALTRTLQFDPRSDLRSDLWYEFSMDGFPLSIMGTQYVNDPLEIRFRTGDGTEEDPPAPTRVVFQEDVWPIIGAGGCACHNETSRAMEFVIHDDPESFLVGSVATGSREWPGWQVIEPGRHDSSYLIYKLLGDERLGLPTIMGDRMPPVGPALSMDEIRIIRDWIEQGAAR